MQLTQEFPADKFSDPAVLPTEAQSAQDNQQLPAKKHFRRHQSKKEFLVIGLRIEFATSAKKKPSHHSLLKQLAKSLLGQMPTWICG